MFLYTIYNNMRSCTFATCAKHHMSQCSLWRFFPVVGVVISMAFIFFGVCAKLSTADRFVVIASGAFFGSLMACAVHIHFSTRTNNLKWRKILSPIGAQLTVHVVSTSMIMEERGKNEYRSMQSSPCMREPFRQCLKLSKIKTKTLSARMLPFPKMPNMDTHFAYVQLLEQFLRLLQIRPQMLERRVQRRRTVHEVKLGGLKAMNNLSDRPKMNEQIRVPLEPVSNESWENETIRGSERRELPSADASSCEEIVPVAATRM
eukprot:GEMP01007365.1.p2 GENE.GEMP01007365.1~~GEMP01007365.1.p2  ORF type:complete len:261 (+),score=61.11 GEMP01007365.1:336-1118(+)